MAIVYVLTNTANGKRYVGKTKKSLDERWTEHRYGARRGSRMALHAAIRKYGAHAFLRAVISEHATEEEALVAERHAIMSLGTMAPTGYNTAEGGRGATGDFMSAEALARWARPEFREKVTAAVRATKATPECRARLSAAARERSRRPESRAAQADAQAARWADPEYRARVGAAISATRTPEYLAAQAERSRRLGATPEGLARAIAMSQSPQAQARRAAQRARPCKHCGGPRVQLRDGQMRCRPCHAKGEKARLDEIRAQRG